MMLKLKNAALSVQINPLGAELSSVKTRDGVQRLWQGDPAVWAGRAPVLFPVAGGFINNRYTYRGKTYEMPQHGFAKNSMFRAELQRESYAALTLDDDQPNYPFQYRFVVAFSLVGDTPALRVTYAVENRGECDMYFGLGAHEAFACPEGIEAYEVVFPQDDLLRHSVLSGAQITRDTRDYRLRDGALTLCKKMFVPDALVFTALKSRAVILKSPLHARTVRVDFPDFDNLLLWQKPGAKYLCIEPWVNPPEFTDHDGDITHKPGVCVLKPGAARTFSHTITFG